MSRLLYGDELARWIYLHYPLSLRCGVRVTQGQLNSLESTSNREYMNLCVHDPEIVRDTTWEM